MINKTITYERVVDAIYTDLLEKAMETNTLDSKELQERYDCFYNKYIEPIYNTSYKTAVNAFDEFNDVVWGYSKKSFEAGFQAAMELLTHKSINKGGDVA